MQKATFSLLALVCLAILTGCAGTTSTTTSHSSTATTTYTLTATTPIVIATSANGDIATDKAIFAAFGSAIDSTTINANTFRVATAGNAAVSGSVSYDATNHIAYFRPSSGWAANTTYVATLSTDIKGTDGTSLPAAFTFTFTTRATPDLSAPSTIAGNGGCVPADAVSVTFDEDMDSTTINSSTFLVAGVTGTVTYDAVTRTATFTPSTPFSSSQSYTLTLTTGVKDLGGVALGGNVVLAFTTCAGSPGGGVGGKQFCHGNGVDWHLNAHLNLLLNQHFGDLMNSFLMVGLSSGGHASWDAHGQAALDTFLGQSSTENVLPMGQLNGIFNDLVTWPAGTNISGDLLVEAAALNLNLILGGYDANDASFGHLVVSGLGNPIDGLTIDEVRAIINTYIATGQLPTGLHPNDMLHLVKNINLAFHGCTASDWAKQHLVVVANIR